LLLTRNYNLRSLFQEPWRLVQESATPHSIPQAPERVCP
jgi:hypothetical protein